MLSPMNSSKCHPGPRSRIQRGTDHPNTKTSFSYAACEFNSAEGVSAALQAELEVYLSKRRTKSQSTGFKNLESVVAELKSVFDIDICDGLKDTNVAFASLTFHRRHVYEHNGGEVDEKYIAEGGDKSVRLKQALHETQQSVHQFTNLVAKMACNLHRGFHGIFPPEREPISLYAEAKNKMKAHGQN
jgi:hypothetical protein